jgi:hypothetical protein
VDLHLPDQEPLPYTRVDDDSPPPLKARKKSFESLESAWLGDLHTTKNQKIAPT